MEIDTNDLYDKTVKNEQTVKGFLASLIYGRLCCRTHVITLATSVAIDNYNGFNDSRSC